MDVNKSQGLVGAAVRYFHEILFVSAIALAFITALLCSSIYWSARYTYWMAHMNGLFHRHWRDQLGDGLTFGLCALAVVIVFILTLRLFSRASFMAWTLRTAAGVLTIAAPAACFWFVKQYLRSGYATNHNLDFMVYEECIAIICVILFVKGRWPISVWTSVVLVTLHGLLWFRAYLFTIAGWSPHFLAVPVSAYLSTLMWGYYFNTMRRKMRPRPA
jgi:hypothetical protein